MFESDTPAYGNIAPDECKKLLETQEVQLLDVRETQEFAFCSIPGSVNIPLSLLPLRFQELDRSRTTVVLCHHGARSYYGCRFLEKQGFRNVLNLAGGIDMYARTVDRTIPTY